MSEPFKIRVGSKSNKGTLKSENDDRILIGMDPAANDWLFSPDPVQVGEFGTVLLLADGLGDSENGGAAANAVCKTIKKLFDETLELPPSDDEKLRLLIKFFQIAQKQLQLHSLEHHSHKNIGASSTLVLLLENKAFIVWLGNCRAYRYNSKEQRASFFSKLPNLELLTVDHTFETEKILFDGYREEKYFYPTGVSKYVSTEIISQDVSVSLISLKKSDRILICSEGLFTALTNENIQEILSSSEDPEITADELISRAFNNGTEKNISAIVADILEVQAGIPVIKNSEISDISKARLLYGAPVASEVLPPLPAETLTPKKKEKQVSDAEDLVPVKLRTVMPEPEPNSSEDDENPQMSELTEKDIPAGGQISLEWPIETQAEQLNDLISDENEEEKIEEELEGEIEEDYEEHTQNQEPSGEDSSGPIADLLVPEAPSSQIQGEMAERLARLKIKMTVYPDPEDKAQGNDEIISSDPISGIPLQEGDKEDQENTGIISIDLYDEIDSDDEIEEPAEISDPSSDQIFEDIIVQEYDEIDQDIELEEETETPIEIPEPFESAILPLSEEFVIDLQDDPEIGSDEAYSDEYDEDFILDSDMQIEEEMEEDKVLEVIEDLGEEEITDEHEIELELVISPIDIPDKVAIPEPPVTEKNHAGASVQKPIAHLIGTNKDDQIPATTEKKSKLWPYFVVLGFLILIPIWICKDNSGLNSDNNMDEASAAISTGDENPDSQTAEVAPLPTDSEQDSEPLQEPEEEDENEALIVDPPAKVVPDLETEKPVEKKKEETKPKTDSRQPKYDDDVEKNKHQLIGEVQALLQQKDQLCKQINTYSRNAPESKSESIKQVQNKCDQLGQKFSSIYDQKSGYFKTVRYDFMKGTIKSIRVSMDQIDQQFKIIRGE